MSRPEDVRTYQVYLTNEKKASWSVLNTTACALRFLYRHTLNKEWTIERIPCPKKERRLPVVPSQDEVSAFLKNIPNIKHRVILTTAYAAGLRISEVVSLHVPDIDSGRMVIRIEQGKGRKDRYVMLSPNLLELLRTYWRIVRPRTGFSPARTPESISAAAGSNRSARELLPPQA